jgi:hypothetical protein
MIKKIKENNVETQEEIALFEEKLLKWAKELSDYTGINIEDAIKIGKNRKEAQQEQLAKLEKRQYRYFDTKRVETINDIKKDYPLVQIEGKKHAFAIIGAYKRHVETNYDEMLEKAKEMAFSGLIEKDEISKYAKKMSVPFKQNKPKKPGKKRKNKSSNSIKSKNLKFLDFIHEYILKFKNKIVRIINKIYQSYFKFK